MCFYAKHRLMEMHGYRIVARSIGRVQMAGLSFLERCTFYREDALLVLIVVPALLLLLLRYLGPRARALSTVVVGLPVFVLMFVQMRAFDEVGRYLTFEVMCSTWAFLDNDPEILDHYLDLRSVLKILVPCLVILGLALGAWWLDPRRNLGARTRKLSQLSGRLSLLGLWPLMCVLSGLLWLPGFARDPYHQSALLRVLLILGGSSEVDTGPYEKLTDAELRDAYFELTNAPRPTFDARYSGKAAGYDVLIWVFETGPARCLAIEGELQGFPTLRRLRKHSFVGTRHHSTYPYTNRALFSLFSSWYPSSLTRNYSQQLPDLEVAGMPRALRRAGYECVIYSPIALTFENDERMYRALGVDRFVYGEAQDAEGAPRSDMRRLDGLTLERLKADLTSWIQKDRRFLASFHPQIGHAPWRDVSEAGNLQTPLARGRAVLQLQDRWLGELVEVLEKQNRLDRTLILVTADHGIRTRIEDPSFEGGKLDAYSYHVPCLLWAPGVLEETFLSTALTSHIDLQPTILDLLGITPLTPQQGCPVWDERLQQRTTFFFGNQYLGADGFHRQGLMAMRSHMSDSVFVHAGALEFGDGDLVPPQDAMHEQVTDTLRRIVGLQETWVRRFGGK